MLRPPNCVLALPCAVLAGAAVAQPQVPSTEELAVAQSQMNAVLSNRLIQLHGGNPAAAASDLLFSALNCHDRATSYLLWQESIAIVGRCGRYDLAIVNHLAMAAEFGLDEPAHLETLLRRFAGDEDTNANASLAATALALAWEHSVDAEPRQMLTLFDLAVRQAMRCGDTEFYGYVRDAIDPLRAVAATASRLSHALAPHPESASLARALIDGVGGAWQDHTIRILGPLLDEDGRRALDALGPTLSFGELGAEQLQTLSQHAAQRAVRIGLLRSARNRLLSDLAGSAPADTPALCERLLSIAGHLAQRDGVDRFTFEAPARIDRFTREHGRWQVAEGRLVGIAEGTDNYATAKVAFRDVHCVVIRGGIGSAEGLNFRCKVGQVNLLLNWECEPQNHLWIDGQCHRTTPHALVPGREHTILLLQTAGQCCVCIDGQLLWAVPGSLDGAVTIYPAIGSEIFVREILVDGLPNRLIDGADRPLM